MASIKGITLKKVKTFTGREGEGATADIYMDGKKIGSYADYADGGFYPDIRIDEVYQDDFDARVRQYYTEYTPLFKDRDGIVHTVRVIEEKESWEDYYERVSNIWERHAADSSSFFEALLQLIDYEKAFKKYAKQGYKHLVVTNDTVVNNLIEVSPIVFASRSDGQALQEIIERACNNDDYIMPTANIYNSVEDFKIE